MNQVRIVLFAVILLLPGLSSAQQEFQIGRPCFFELCDFTQVEKVLQEAYHRIGKRAVFLSLPRLRELEFANSGKIDGCLVRMAQSVRPYPDLVKVPFPILRNIVVACAVNENVAVREVADLKQYRVGILRGATMLELMCQRGGVVPVIYSKLGNGLRMLSENRIDLILEEKVIAVIAARDIDMELHLSEPLHLGYYYHWLNVKHEDTAYRLAGELRKMAVDGTTAKLLGRYAEMLTGVDLED